MKNTKHINNLHKAIQTKPRVRTRFEPMDSNAVHPRPLRRGRAETSHLCSKQKGAEKENCRGGPSSLKLAQGGPLATACHKGVMAGRARVRGSARADTHTPMTVFVPVYQLS